MKKKFSDLEISDFCNATHDPNLIHNPQFMRKNGKKAIVPGMLTFSYAANLAADFLLDKNPDAHVYFGTPISSGEIVEFEAKGSPFLYDNNPEMKMELCATTEKGNALAADERKSKLLTKRVGNDTPTVGKEKSFQISPLDIMTFGKIIGAKDEKTAQLLYSIAFASNALLKTLKEPYGEIEETIANQLVGNGALPVYKSLNIKMASNFMGIHEDSLQYSVMPSQTGKRDFNFYVTCNEGQFPIFEASYDISAVPEKMIMRKVAKDI